MSLGKLGLFAKQVAPNGATGFESLRFRQGKRSLDGPGGFDSLTAFLYLG